MHRLPTAFPDFGLTPEQRHEAVFGHYYEYPGMDGERGEIWCYAPRFAYRDGETVTLHVSSTATKFRVEIVRDGASGNAGADASRTRSARWQDTPDQCSVEGCGWDATLEFAVADEWPSGAYRITATAEGRDGKPISSDHLIIVRPAPGSKPGRILQVAATGTWTAYNTWGGSNHYQGITGPKRDQFAPMVSIERPLARGFVRLPPEAPRVPLEIALPPLTAPRYPHMEWAFATGHSKKYTSSGWASYDSHFFRWAERAGYAIDLASQHELHFEPELLDGYDCIVCVGHDEYWTWEMRDAVDAYVERGGHAARFAGNFMWQTRLEDDGARQVCYKYRARAEDPAYRGGDVDARHQFLGGAGDRPAGCGDLRAQCHRRPLCRLGRLRAARRARLSDLPPGALGVLRHRPLLRRPARRRQPCVRLRGRRPRPCRPQRPAGSRRARAARRPACRSWRVGMASQVEENADLPAGFLNDEDGRFNAETLYGSPSDENLDKVKRGNGMIVNFKRGKGEVFHAGSCEWVAGLLRRDAMVEKVTKNVLDRYVGER